MDSLAMWKSSPPNSLIIFDNGIVAMSAKIEPKEPAFTMLFIIWELANVQITVRIDLNAVCTSLVFLEVALIKFLVFSNAYALIRGELPIPYLFLLTIWPK